MFNSFKVLMNIFMKEVSEEAHKVKIRAPRDYFERTKVFIEDMRYLSEEQDELPAVDPPISFIVKTLFDNFVDQVRKGKDHLYDDLMSLRNIYGSVLESSGQLTTYKSTYTNNVINLREAPKFQWTLTHTGSPTDEGYYQTLNVTLDPKEVKRVYTFFSDLNCMNKPLNMEVDELISLLFIQFITDLRSGLVPETKDQMIEYMIDKWKAANY